MCVMELILQCGDDDVREREQSVLDDHEHVDLILQCGDDDVRERKQSALDDHEHVHKQHCK